MSTYAIGDLQGCLDDLLRLLEVLAFDPAADRLWFVGDLVNRGHQSAETLRFVRALGDRAITVLGNHDLHLLAVASGATRPKRKDHLDGVLEAADRDELLDWLRHRPLLHHDTALGYTLVHAGLPPAWDLTRAQACAAELEACLRGPNQRRFFRHMYGDEPACWRADLRGWARLRYITNAFTRMRYCDARGCLELTAKGPPGTQPAGLLPWFQVPGRANAALNIVFGHWSTLALAPQPTPNVYPVDSGCVWRQRLTALRLEDGRYFHAPCTGALTPKGY